MRKCSVTCVIVTFQQGVVRRDEIVFQEVREKRGIPIFMLTSGGYQVSRAHLHTHSEGVCAATVRWI